MTEQLPISIYVCDDLTKLFTNVKSISNRLAAQFNFQTMRANWYGDEENILFIQLRLETPQSFLALKGIQQQNAVDTFKLHSDDVFSFIDEQKSKQLMCIISITESEQNLLTQQSKLLPGLLQVKLQKVLNIIAEQLNLSPI